jgi:acyl carrier protein phosphodiesterase
MNFLAHFQLAWPDEDLVAGGLEGDYYKGPLRGTLPAGIEQGVALHRAIDAYTDRHPVVSELRRSMPSTLRRYAGILIDLSFDHYLAVHWERFASLPMGQFRGQVYQLLVDREAQLSVGAQKMLSRLVEHDILALYLHWNTVPATAERLGRRFRGDNPLADVDQALAPIRHLVEKAFLEFYPQLQNFSAATACELRDGVAPRGKTP